MAPSLRRDAFQSVAIDPTRSTLPERFRGGCSFGVCPFPLQRIDKTLPRGQRLDPHSQLAMAESTAGAKLFPRRVPLTLAENALHIVIFVDVAPFDFGFGEFQNHVSHLRRFDRPVFAPTAM